MATTTDSYSPADDSGMGADPQQQGYCIEIRVPTNGPMTVGVEPLSEEASEEGAEDGGEGAGAGEGSDADSGSQGTPVRSKKEALTLALSIMNNEGQMPGQADDQFQQGYQGAKS